MNNKTLFQLLLALVSFFCAQGADAIVLGSYESDYVWNTSYVDYSVPLIAGRKYFIAAIGDYGFNTTLNVSDPSGYYVFNDDYGGSYSSGGYSYAGAAALNFTPQASGVAMIRTATGLAQGYQSTKTYVVDITPCPASCTSCVNSTACSICPKSYRCDNCSNSSELRYGGACTASCPEGTSKNSGICRDCYYMDYYCRKCNETNCLGCTYSNWVVTGTTCWSYCYTGYNNNGICSACVQVSTVAKCLTCTSSGVCSACELGWYYYSNNQTCMTSCPTGYYGRNLTGGGVCNACSSYCLTCDYSSSTCSSCSSGRTPQDWSCVTTCSSGYFNNTALGVCSTCSLVNSNCSTCSNSTICTACSSSSGRYAWGAQCLASCPAGLFIYGTACVSSCPSTTYNNGTNCVACTTLNSYCTSCNDSNTCIACSSSRYAYGATCQTSCPSATYNKNGICTNCSTLNSACTACNSSVTCTACSTGYALGATCTASCPIDTYNKSGVCTNCTTLDSNCRACTNSATCTACSSSSLFIYGATCVSPCPSTTYNNGTHCIACSTLNSYCTSCNNSNTCNACSSSRYAYGATCQTSCPSTTYNKNGICTNCSTLDSACTACNSSVTCTACSSGYALGATCIASCPVTTYNKNGVCTNCTTLNPSCTSCNSSSTCTGCSSGLALGATCVASCPSNTYNNSGICTSCKTLNSACTACNSSTTCTACSSGYALGATCTGSCPNGTFLQNGVCTSCKTLDTDCLVCSSSTSCTTCDSGKSRYGPLCVMSCPSGTYGDANGICQTCQNLDSYCSNCSIPTICDSCDYGYYAFGKTCQYSCPPTTYTDGNKCLNCTNLDANCSSCVNNRTCTSCSNGRLVYGAACVTSCPQGTVNNGGICTFVSLKVSLSNTDSVNNYVVQITSALVFDVDVLAVSKVYLVGVDPSAYSYTLTRQSETSYLISIQNTQTISSTTLRFVYTLDGHPSTKNINIGTWNDQITSKYMAYMSEGTKKAVEAVNNVAGGGMQGASVGASSMAVIGGNPALLWTLMNLFQQFYYLSFIDVNYPANVQMFFKIFSLGSLSFIPNPLDWFVKDIDVYNLPVPQRYNDNSFSGLFLDNAGNELLLLSFVFILFCICKMAKKWLRRLPVSIRFATDKTIGWFQWSGILESLITSYTDIAQSVFLQLKVLTFTSTVFTLSSILCILTLGFIVAFPVLIIFIIRKFSDHPDLLTIQYETLVKGYNIDKVAARNFVPIWLIRRLIMCLSLVFLQGYPYVQITVLSILMIAAIYYCWFYTPYTTRKENICNTLMEIMFFGIHVVIYILVYDDHNPSFSDDQRLQLGWIIIFCCGTILVLSLGLSLFEQVKMIIRGLRMLKQLMSKKEKIKTGKGKPQPRIEDHFSTDQSTLFDLNRSQTDTSPFSSPVLRAAVRANPPPRSMVIEKNLRRARIASRIRELRAMNS